MKNLYLDVDGVLITVDGQHPAPNVLEFLRYIIERYDVYWLSSHCKGEASFVCSYVSRLIPGAEEYVKKIKPTVWSYHKTEGIDFTKEFIWLDDNPSDYDREVLLKNSCLESLHVVTLNDNKYSLLDEVKI